MRCILFIYILIQWPNDLWRLTINTFFKNKLYVLNTKNANQNVKQRVRGEILTHATNTGEPKKHVKDSERKDHLSCDSIYTDVQKRHTETEYRLMVAWSQGWED